MVAAMPGTNVKIGNVLGSGTTRSWPSCGLRCGRITVPRLIMVAPAHIQDRDADREGLGRLRLTHPEIKVVRADRLRRPTRRLSEELPPPHLPYRVPAQGRHRLRRPPTPLGGGTVAGTDHARPPLG